LGRAQTPIVKAHSNILTAVAEDPAAKDSVTDLGMVVDYAATVSEVYQYTAKYIINRDRNLDVLCILPTHHDHNSVDLPTWTPDWRVPVSSIPLNDSPEYFTNK
jgi:hypothetical protein